jgi:anthraniloyl-CoA monooxygenase
MDAVRDDFVAAARRADEAGFDLLELHCAHGYLLSSFLSPLANIRTDEFGGSIENRLRFPLEVFDAIREVWPADKPLTVRISATDWAEGGNTEEDALVISEAFAQHGAAAIDVSSGQVTKAERPEYGRSYQTPFADRIRNEVAAKHGVSVIAVGAISSWDDFNSILLAGRADMCALGRSHLYDPRWTLHAAAEQEYVGAGACGRCSSGLAVASHQRLEPRPFAPGSNWFARMRPSWISRRTFAGSQPLWRHPLSNP